MYIVHFVQELVSIQVFQDPWNTKYNEDVVWWTTNELNMDVV